MNARKARGMGLVSAATLASTSGILVLASEDLINDAITLVNSSVEKETRCATQVALLIISSIST